MTAIDSATAPASVVAVTARIDTAIDALLALRNLAAERPDIANDIVIGKHNSIKMNIYVGNSEYDLPEHCIDVPALIAELAEAAARHGATLRPDKGPEYGGVRAAFGPFELYIYARLEQVGTSAVREVTEWQLDPRLAAFGTETSQ